MSPIAQTPGPQQVWLGEVMPRSRFFRRWEYLRHHQVHPLIECLAEALGSFFFMWTGTGISMSLLSRGIASPMQVGASYGIGIVFGLVVNLSTSGGHINPCVTIALATYRDFPWRKVPQYILAQILGAYLGCLAVYLQYADIIKQLEERLREQGLYDSVMFTPSGVPGAFALYPNPGKSLGLIFWNEFITDFLLGFVVWACIDPSNFVTSPVAGTWIIGTAYAIAIWAFTSANHVSTNTCRDLGSRLMVLTIWGPRASGGQYAAIAALTNIPAMLLAALCYEFLHHDSSRVIAPAHYAQMMAHKAHLDRRLGLSQSDYNHPGGIQDVEGAVDHGQRTISEISGEAKGLKWVDAAECRKICCHIELDAAATECRKICCHVVMNTAPAMPCKPEM